MMLQKEGIGLLGAPAIALIQPPTLREISLGSLPAYIRDFCPLGAISGRCYDAFFLRRISIIMNGIAAMRFMNLPVI
ncbi:MAG: hypothetical protein JO235_08365 [Chroococcidiopsidaceae cyanobacterium CP_BM_RX_35]|nr:hypothetical protein [Chroococcidiopsidaceae cyanobacterium CP_BM_RX_35]